MLNELSMAKTMVRPPLARAIDGRMHVRAGEGQNEQRDEEAAQGEKQQILQAAVLDGALRPPLEEHERTERHGLLAVLPKQVDVNRAGPSTASPAKNHGAMKPNYILLWRSGEKIAQALVERLGGVQKKVIQTGGAGFFGKQAACARRSSRWYSLRA